VRNAYDPHLWSDFLAATVGAGTGLAGLIFVALSINLGRLVSRPKLATRAGETLAMLLLAVVGAALGLVPLSRTGYATTLLVIASPVWIVTLLLQLQQGSDSPDDPRWWFLSRLAVTQCVAVPFVVTGVSLLIRRGGGMFWLTGGALAALAGSVYNAWILLVEIVRNERPEIG
jgi:modulator of FtsH protease